MIDEKLLRQLGWSEDLIKEVRRVGDDIDEISKNITDIGEPMPKYESVSGNSVNYFQQEIDSGSDIILDLIKEKEDSTKE